MSMDFAYYTDEQVKVFSWLSDNGPDTCEGISDAAEWEWQRTRRVLGELEAEGWVICQVCGCENVWRAV